MKKVVKFLIVLAVLLILLLLYSRYIGTSGLNVNEYKVANYKITDEYHGLKIVQLSDVHYGSTVFEKELESIINEINLLKPDIVVLTGDLIDEDNYYDKDVISNYLSQINVTIGKYAISGNHDIIDDYKYILNNSGFTNLDDTYELIYKSNKPIIISGISTSIGVEDISTKTLNFDNYINNLPEEEKPSYSILLMHEPDLVDKINIDNYDLVLSGHSHGGQVKLPLLTKLFLPNGSQKYYNAHYKINNTELYINNGIGTSGPKFRLFSRPSINFYRLVKEGR